MSNRAVIVVEFDWPGIGMDEQETMEQVVDVVIPLIRSHVNEALHPQAHMAIRDVAQAVISALAGPEVPR